MRTPGRKRPRPQALARDPDLRELENWAASASYIGSPEHKTYPSFAGPPKLRSDATPCPQEFKDASIIQTWLREEIRQGNVSAYRDQGTFPRYVWGRRGNRWFEARLVNAQSGAYKGYPVTEESIPNELRKRAS